MDAMEALKTRKSIRNYQSKPVEDDMIQEMIAACNNAPRAGSLHISVIRNPELLNKISKAALYAMKACGNHKQSSVFSMKKDYRPTYGAPLLFLLSAPKDEQYCAVNTALAAGNLCNAATALGLGSCYVASVLQGFPVKPELAQRAGVPEGYAPMCGVLAGYPAEEKTSLPKQIPHNVNFCD